MWIFLALIVVPLVEIGLFIKVGGVIGLWPTIAIVIATAVIGSALLRMQGLAALGELREKLDRGGNPGPTLAHGALILVAGVLLLTPGFFTDTVGFLLLVPPVRAMLIARMADRIVAQSVHVHTARHPGPGGPMPGGDTIDGTYEEVDPEDTPRQDEGGDRRVSGNSGWTRPRG